MADGRRSDWSAADLGTATGVAAIPVALYFAGGWPYVIASLAVMVAFMGYYIHTVDKASHEAFVRRISRDPKILAERRAELVMQIEQIDRWLVEDGVETG